MRKWSSFQGLTGKTRMGKPPRAEGGASNCTQVPPPPFSAPEISPGAIKGSFEETEDLPSVEPPELWVSSGETGLDCW